MPAAVSLIGLALGMLMAAVGLALWNDLRGKATGISRAVQVIGWMAGALLLVAATLLWLADHGHCTRVMHLTLMAAIAAPPTGRQRHYLPWRDAIPMLPALALTGTSLFLVTGGTWTGCSALTLVGLIFMVCDGLVVRVLGEALSVVVNPNLSLGRMFDVLYLLLTLLVGGTALTSLWQRGSVWGGTADETSLAGAWLAWSAAWLSPRDRRRLRAGLVAVAALLLTALALRAS